ncbi:MAG TPA: YggS family pyridoxal phosphate-dependent enzyme [Candidatus Binataceae bacterium]|nr:YggS family pyridoxal phosphate-dependent enzyme [Candidatus Binataceae bacterium]
MLADPEIQARLDEVRGRIAASLRRSGRPPDSCRLVLATKTQPAAAILAAYAAGARDFGENYVREAAFKRAELGRLPGAIWHLLGHLQTNKARAAVQTFDVIQTLDNSRLAAALARLQPAPRVQTLIEINLGGETAKSGIAPSDAEELLDAVRAQVEVAGLMTVPPQTAEPAAARRYFARLRELRDELAASSGLALSELSMGMTDDYEIAIAEGATIVRVGRAIFGPRPPA